jgi:hypothetical protein
MTAPVSGVGNWPELLGGGQQGGGVCSAVMSGKTFTGSSLRAKPSGYLTRAPSHVVLTVPP